VTDVEQIYAAVGEDVALDVAPQPLRLPRGPVDVERHRAGVIPRRPAPALSPMD
jgi:hypothetical protein